MPLKLVTGPANAAKAGEVLGGLRARLDEDPVLVVPTFADVEHAQRELAERGAIFGARVMRFEWLFGEIATRVGFASRRASDFQRELIVEEAVRRARLEMLAESASQPGFVRAAAHFFAELGQVRNEVSAARLTRALRDWAADGPRRQYAEEIAAIYRAYREGLEAAGLVDAELYGRGALDALRNSPREWGRTPVFVYGFDDFNGLQLDALETLARHCDVDVTVSLPYERGRLAFRSVSGVHQELLAIGGEELELAPLDDHYASEARPVLHHVERSLFEDGADERVEPGEAVSFHSAGGERAEVELVAKRLLELLRTDVTPGDVAVVFRDPTAYSSLLEQVFGAYGIPYSIDRTLPFGHTGLGRGLLALIRAAGPAGTADDLLAYLRTPGLLTVPGFADSLEAEVRREGEHSAAEARARWERDRWPLEELDRLARARDTGAYAAELERRLATLFAAPYRRTATVLSGPQLEEARAFAKANEALAELRAVLGTRPADPAQVLRVMEQLEVHVGDPPQPDRVQVAAPREIRARRFEVVFCCGLQEGEFPRNASPEPFLSDDDRRAIATASGLVLPVREDRLDRERYLFYVCASRAERLLVLSSRSSDEEGNPQTESYFVDDVRHLLEDLAARDGVGARALENFADCPVKWLVEDLLRPAELVPDPEAMVRGSYAHKVLEVTYQQLREQTGDCRVTPANLATAERILLAALEAERGEFRLSPDQTRVRAAVRRLEFDLLRYLRHEAGRDGSFEPEYLELRFGFEDSDHPAVELADGTRVRGFIDRIDTWDGWALVRDYKSGKTEKYKVADWEKENRFQAALYMLVAKEALGLKPAGGVYVPLGGTDRRPRGMVAEELSEQLGSDFVDNDRVPEADFAERTEWAKSSIATTATRMRGGDLVSCPDSCAWRGGCSHPSICRSRLDPADRWVRAAAAPGAAVRA